MSNFNFFEKAQTPEVLTSEAPYFKYWDEYTLTPNQVKTYGRGLTRSESFGVAFFDEKKRLFRFFCVSDLPVSLPEVGLIGLIKDIAVDRGAVYYASLLCDRISRFSRIDFEDSTSGEVINELVGKLRLYGFSNPRTSYSVPRSDTPLPESRTVVTPTSVTEKPPATTVTDKEEPVIEKGPISLLEAIEENCKQSGKTFTNS